MEPDDSKITAILEIPEASDKKGTQRLLGLTNYVAMFSLKLSEVTSPLRELLQKDVDWHWEEHKKSFENVKKLLSSDRCIKAIYNSSGCKQCWFKSCIIIRRRTCGICIKITYTC